MSFKDFSTSQKASEKAKPADKPKSEAPATPVAPASSDKPKA